VGSSVQQHPDNSDGSPGPLPLSSGPLPQGSTIMQSAQSLHYAEVTAFKDLPLRIFQLFLSCSLSKVQLLFSCFAWGHSPLIRGHSLLTDFYCRSQ
jgi:hypothetical protein